MVPQINVCLLSHNREEKPTDRLCLIETTSTERIRSRSFLSTLWLSASGIQK